MNTSRKCEQIQSWIRNTPVNVNKSISLNQSIQSINQSIFNLNSHKHFYSVEKKNRIHLNIVYNLHIEDDK